jgi:hypothetical protein
MHETMNQYPYSIVVDLDDTLSFTHNRDWENATPNRPLIEKLNRLYDNGWSIHIVTARGQLSCGGSEKARRKYEPVAKAWLTKHGVKYTDLSFQKKLGLYYIDDKGVTPEKFLKDFQFKELKSGLSGAKVHYDPMTNHVYKTTEEHPKNVVDWYKHAEQKGFKVPKIHSVIGSTLRMEYLSDDSNLISEAEKIRKVADLILNEFPKKPPVYIDTKHSNEDRIDYVLDKIFNVSLNFNRSSHVSTACETDLRNISDCGSSFSHGDASIDNFIYHAGEIYMIDPIHNPDKPYFCHFLDDYAKLVFSLYTFKDYPLDAIFKIIPSYPFIFGLGLANAARVYPYAVQNRGHEFAQTKVFGFMKDVFNLYAIRQNK